MAIPISRDGHLHARCDPAEAAVDVAERPIEALENRMFATAIEVNGKMLPIRLYASVCVCVSRLGLGLAL